MNVFIGVFNVNEIGLQMRNDSVTRGHNFKLYKQCCKRSVRSPSFFTEKVVNSLPSKEANFSGIINAFQQSI